jgi:hypothetical protein
MEAMGIYLEHCRVIYRGMLPNVESICSASFKSTSDITGLLEEPSLATTI